MIVHSLQGTGPGPGTYPPKLEPYEPPVPGADMAEKNGRMSEERRRESSPKTVTCPPSSASTHSLDEKGACGSDRPHEISSSSPHGSLTDSLVEENNHSDGGRPLYVIYYYIVHIAR